MFACDELRYVVHRAWPIERVHSDEVLEHGRLEFLEIFLHSGTFELERTYGAPFGVEAVGVWVVNGNVEDVDVDSVPLFDVADGLFHDCERN